MLLYTVLSDMATFPQPESAPMAGGLETAVPDEAPPSSIALKNTIISAISNLSTAYNLVVINIVHVLIQNQYCGGDNCEAETELVATSSLVGAIIGQLTFGYVGDWLGRSRALQLTMAMSVLGALLSAFAVPINSDPASVFLFLSATRFVLGLGVGGVYPLSATIAAESSSKASRGRNASLVFSMQGVANVLVPVLALALVSIFGTPRAATSRCRCHAHRHRRYRHRCRHCHRCRRLCHRLASASASASTSATTSATSATRALNSFTSRAHGVPTRGNASATTSCGPFSR